MVVFRLFFSAGQIHIRYPIRIHCFYMFISALCSNLKPPELSLAPESRHRHGTRQFAMFIAETNGKPMVKSRLLPFFQQKPTFFLWKRWKSHQKRSHVPFFHHGINLQNLMMKTFQKSRAKLMSLSELTSLLENLPDCLDIEPFWTQSLCVNPGTKTQKYRWWWFQCQRFPNIVGLYLFTSLQSPSVFRKVVTVTQRLANLWAEASEHVWNVNPSLHGHLVVRQIWAYFIYNCHSWPPKVRKFWMIPCFFRTINSINHDHHFHCEVIQWAIEFTQTNPG